MKLLYQFVLGLVLLLAIMSSLTRADPSEDNKSNESLSGNSESDGSVPDDAQQDYLNVADFTTASPPWWWN
ncbi:uncharacterized protein LOC108092852 [Drosophila ficusphila]|uniref:uncharacterized protein LOC108092852 n=1 Tax=Drosophila ficusphila TaxID=30025 RepID=UPI0007E7802F|nr:uncharacterized protein LOC108092852 [Drosophila ficusphila]